MGRVSGKNTNKIKKRGGEVLGAKDITEKTLESYNDVFADIVNVLLFNGRQVIEEDKLDESTPRSIYKADEKIHEQERDVAKYWKDGSNIRIALLGLENQTLVDKDMPLRIISYDGAAYRAQLSENKAVARYPVVTLVLYFGYKKHWDKSLNLLDCLEIPEDFKPYVNDYKINLFEIAYLEDEQVQMFKSDFRIVADYFVQMRKNRNYIPEPQTIQHVQETLQLLSVMAGDKRFEIAYNLSNNREVTNMCEVLDRIEARGEAKGRAKERLSLLTDLVKDGSITLEKAAQKAGMTVEEFKAAAEL